MHNFARECRSHRRKNFLPHVRYVATIPCESVRHKSNTFHTILALCTCLYRSHLRKPVLMKQTKSIKSEAQNICSKCLPFTWTHAFKRLCHCAIAAVIMVWSSSRHSFNSFTSYPLLKDTPDVVHRVQIWRIGWPHLWRDKIWRLSLQHGDSVTCTVNGMI